MSWLLLIIAGVFEVGFATCLGKARETGSNTFACMIGFFVCLSICTAIRKIKLRNNSDNLDLETEYCAGAAIK